MKLEDFFFIKLVIYFYKYFGNQSIFDISELNFSYLEVKFLDKNLLFWKKT